MFVVLGVHILNVVHPVKVLDSFVEISWMKANVALGKVGEKAGELLLDRG